jgi:pimeloyl-ACP methyl ester carboxylesterase
MIRLRFAEAIAIASVVCFAACSSDEDHPPTVSDGAGPPGTQAKLPSSASGRLVGTVCPFTVPTGWDARCGKLTVPADRTGANTTRSLSLAVAVFKSSSAAPAADPVVYLAGGPGSPALDDVAAQATYFEPLLADRDLIVFDQRGTGHSVPALLCPDLYSSKYPPDAGIKAPVQDCRDQLVASGVVPSDYTTAANAADVADLGRELGYAAWNLFGISYGTRLALTVMRDHPEGVRSVVIDSVLPLDVDFIAEGPANAEAAFDALFASCASQPSCLTGYPNLKTVFYNLVDQLNRTPATVPTSNGNYAVSGTTLVNVMYQLLYSGESLPYLPEVIFQTREQRYTVLSKILPLIAESDAAMGIGMYFSVVCADMFPFTALAAGQAPTGAVAPQITDALGSSQMPDICSVWNVPASGAIEHQPVQSSIETLVLSGGHDPVTPPRWAQAVSQSLPRSFFILYQSQAHGVFTNTCAAGMLSSFLRDPSADPAGQCPSRTADVIFVVPSTRLLGGTASGALNLGALKRSLTHPLR